MELIRQPHGVALMPPAKRGILEIRDDPGEPVAKRIAAGVMIQALEVGDMADFDDFLRAR